MENEIWKPIKDHCGYEVSNLGRVRSLIGKYGPRSEPKIITPGFNNKRYLHFTACTKGGRKTLVIHRLVLQAFIGSCPEGQEAAHINGVRTDNRLENLMWCSRKENHFHKQIHGTHLRGEDVKNAKLSSKDASQIKMRIKNGEKLSDIASDFKVSLATVSNIKHGRRWAHIA